MSSSYWKKSQEDWDKSQEEQNPERPKQVLYAVYLIYAQIAISIIILMVDVPNRPSGSYTPFIICALTIAFLIAIWSTSRIAAGRNWARILYLVFVILSLFSVIDLVQNIADDPLPWSRNAISTILGLIVLVLLFKSPSNTWFKQGKCVMSLKKVSIGLALSLSSFALYLVTPDFCCAYGNLFGDIQTAWAVISLFLSGFFFLALLARVFIDSRGQGWKGIIKAIAIVVMLLTVATGCTAWFVNDFMKGVGAVFGGF